MQKNDYFFIKLIVILVVAILVLVSVIYLLQRGSLSDTELSNNWSFNKNQEENTVVEDNNEIVDDVLPEEFAPEKLLPNRRYIETKAEFCEEGVMFSCDEREFEFNDETGCGCELKKEFINNNPSPVDKNDDDFLPSEEELPIVCTMEYAPVCGMKDGAYQTFGNDCMAEGAGVFDYTQGECE